MKFTISLGQVRGRDLGDVIHVSNLPYAQAPIGSMRFALPQPMQPWTGIRDSTEPTPVPPQLPSRLAAVMGDYPATQSEDCLKLDIWIPKASRHTDATALPVTVFIHGGAFMTGGGGLPCYDAAVLAHRGRMIVVTISYRLGMLGFLALEHITPPNLGLHDQIAALRFIRREIACFGGDANNVTVVGQSAGALSIAAFLANPQSRDLFNRAVLISTPLGLGKELQTQEQAHEMSASLLHEMGMRDKEWPALVDMDVAELLECQAQLLRLWARRCVPVSVSPPFRPVIDGDLIIGQPGTMLAKNPPAWCPVIIGATREEMAAFWFAREDLEAYAKVALPADFERAFPGQGAQMLAAFRARRASGQALALLIDLHSWVEFIKPSFDFAAQLTRAGGSAYAYMFDWQSPNRRIGACHCIELPFLFGNIETWQHAPLLAGVPKDELDALSNIFQNSLASFARTGDPAAQTELPWPVFGTAGTVMHFDRLTSCSTRAEILP